MCSVQLREIIVCGIHFHLNAFFNLHCGILFTCEEIFSHFVDGGGDGGDGGEVLYN